MVCLFDCVENLTGQTVDNQVAWLVVICNHDHRVLQENTCADHLSRKDNHVRYGLETHATLKLRECQALISAKSQESFMNVQCFKDRAYL